MITSTRIATGAEPVGGKSPTPPRLATQQYALLQKDFTSSQQAVPVPVIYGRAQVAAIQMTPIFGFRSEDDTSGQQGGK